MSENLELLSLIAVPFYIILFHITGFVLIRDLWDMNPHEHPNWEIIYKTGLRGEQISYTLTGFAILALVFIISIFIDNLANAELVIVFFSLGFILEVFSAFLFHFFSKFGFQYISIWWDVCHFTRILHVLNQYNGVVHAYSCCLF